MTEYQVTYWRELPSLVVARRGDDMRKTPLDARFQFAIDEAAMRLGDIGSDAYLAGWHRGDWTVAEGDPVDVAHLVATELAEEWPAAALEDYLDGLGKPE